MAASAPLICIGGTRPAGNPGNMTPITERRGAAANGAGTRPATGAAGAGAATTGAGVGTPAGPDSASSAGSRAKGGAGAGAGAATTGAAGGLALEKTVIWSGWGWGWIGRGGALRPKKEGSGYKNTPSDEEAAIIVRSKSVYRPMLGLLRSLAMDNIP